MPSEKGYRFYVDHLLTPEKLKTEDSFQLRSIFQEKIVETEELIRKSATILSDLTNYTSILLGPDTSLHAVKRFSIVPLDETNSSRHYCDGQWTMLKIDYSMYRKALMRQILKKW